MNLIKEEKGSQANLSPFSSICCCDLVKKKIADSILRLGWPNFIIETIIVNKYHRGLANWMDRHSLKSGKWKSDAFHFYNRIWGIYETFKWRRPIRSLTYDSIAGFFCFSSIDCLDRVILLGVEGKGGYPVPKKMLFSNTWPKAIT